MAIISELYFKMTGAQPHDVEERAIAKAIALKEMQATIPISGPDAAFRSMCKIG